MGLGGHTLPIYTYLYVFCSITQAEPLPAAPAPDPICEKLAVLLDPDAPKSSFLRDTMAIAHANLPPPITRTYASGVRNSAKKCSGQFDWVLAFSGTDVIIKVFSNLSALYKYNYDVDLKFAVLSSCENEPAKQNFIMKEHGGNAQDGVHVLFGDVKDMLAPTAINVFDGKSVPVRKGRAYFGGFSCVSRSNHNVHAKANLNCIQRKDPEAQTAVTYHAAADFVFAGNENGEGFEVCLLENLEKLEQKEEAALQSDAEYIISDFNSHGWEAMLYRIEATENGSWPTRFRLFIVGLRGRSAAHRARLCHISVLLNAMQVGPSDAHHFLLSDIELATLRSSTTEPAQKASKTNLNKAAKTDYKAELMNLYEESEIPWPPRFSDYPFIDFHTFSDRESQCVLLCHLCFPPPPQSINGSIVVQGFDANLGISRLLGDKGTRNPWKSVLPTMVGSSKFVIRIVDATGLLTIRQLTGVEAMRCIGWDICDWKEDPLRAGHPDSLLRNLAGNAFSAFAVAPLIAAVVAVQGMFDSLVEPEPDNANKRARRAPPGLETASSSRAPPVKDPSSSSESSMNTCGIDSSDSD